MDFSLISPSILFTDKRLFLLISRLPMCIKDKMSSIIKFFIIVSLSTIKREILIPTHKKVPKKNLFLRILGVPIHLYERAPSNYASDMIVVFDVEQHSVATASMCDPNLCRATIIVVAWSSDSLCLKIWVAQLGNAL
jgi:hypothetical protein